MYLHAVHKDFSPGYQKMIIFKSVYEWNCMRAEPLIHRDKRENEQSVLPCQKLQINQVRSKQQNIPGNKQNKWNCEEKVKWLHLSESRIH